MHEIDVFMIGLSKTIWANEPMDLIPSVIKYGDIDVALHVRLWKRRREMVPYFRTDLLNPGQCWRDAPTSWNVKGYTEHYVQLDDGPIPVGVMIARELRDSGSSSALCTDLTLGKLRLVSPDLILVDPEPPLAEILAELHTANGGSWRGLPDAIAILPNGRIAMREAKVAKKDRLNPNQHNFARIARLVLGSDLDLAVVEWGYDAAE
jgi:hypothetical protein